MSILIRDATLKGKPADVYVEDNRIAEIGERVEAEHVIEANGKVLVPGLVNTHTHAAMALFRGYADDLKLKNWLEEHIWPAEAKLTEEDVYWGTRLACVEMIRTGTTCFNDMYWHLSGALKAVEESGLRAVLSSVYVDAMGEETEKSLRMQAEKAFKLERSGRIQIALGPHAIYTVSAEGLSWVKEKAEREDCLIHIHLSETRGEVEDCVREHGMRPTEYLDSLGFLGPEVVCAHCVWLNNKEMKMLGERGVKVAHCPTSNMKLSVGSALDYYGLKAEGVTVGLGTDGCASNNNLDMYEAMKFAALLQKMHFCDETLMPAEDAYSMASSEGAKCLGLEAGKVKEGMLADLALLDALRPDMVPNHNTVSNLVYSSCGYCTDTLICDGQILMKEGVVEGEAEVLEAAAKSGCDLFSR